VPTRPHGAQESERLSADPAPPGDLAKSVRVQ
jgi:hypothetical protein